jgi:formylglycine-generating enzyme required for sulfatase activity
MRVPKVFLSSTRRDLLPYRAAAHEAARAAGFLSLGMEDFAPSGDKYSLEKCLEYVDQADVVVVLVAHWYGSEPHGHSKSFTWLECEYARDTRDIEVIGLVVREDDHQWPFNYREESRLATCPDEALRAIGQLRAFKEWLSKYVTAEFSTPPEVRYAVFHALTEWKKRHPGFGPPPAGNPSDYLDKLREATRYIKIEGIQKTGAAKHFEIRQIYIPLTSTGSEQGRGAAVEHQREVPLESALAGPNLLIEGDPGGGKTTFLRRVAFELCQADPESQGFLGFQDGSFPILISVFELFRHIHARHVAPHPATPDSPEWIIHFLERYAGEHNWNVTGQFFRQKLQQGPCRLLFDGLDEAPDTPARQHMARLLESAATAYPKCHFVVTTRPVAEAAMSGFNKVQLGPLTAGAIHTFLDEWSGALYGKEADQAKAFREALKLALDSRADIRSLARNPVMLTALAVLQANNRILPQHRVELYEAILAWLAKARESKPERVSAERCLELLQKLAFAMQADPGGRKRQAGKGWAADQLAGEFQTREQALDFLGKEETDSGIIVSRGADVQYWHLTFLEYLAARRIAALPDAEQHRIVTSGGNLYKQEWREVMRLLGGVLMFKQGREKVDELFKAILDQLGEEPALPAQAQCAALLGAMMRDLERMEYKPNDPRYEQTLHAMRSLFDPVQCAGIDLRTRIEAAEALGQAGDPRLEEENWIRIRAGKFRRGEPPGHEVTLAGFEIGRYPVTVQEYQKFIEEGGYKKEDYWGETGGFGQFKEPENWEEQQSHGNRPVTGVSWWEAAAYCKWAKSWLPTEAEWERAARGTRENAEYPWGNDPIDETRANYDHKVGRPTPVGLYPKGATTEGVDDMLGNVWEWCADWFGDYPKAHVENPKGPQSGQFRVLRGGSWNNQPYNVRVSNRYLNRPVCRYDNIGFRCVRESLNP